MTDPAANANAYLRTKVMGAKPEELRLMLIEGAVKFARQARMGLESKDFEKSYLGFGQCRDIVTELMTSVRSDDQPELADRIRAFYAFIYSELVACSFERDLPKLDKVIELLEFEVETWKLAVEKLRIERQRNPAAFGAGAAAAAGPRAMTTAYGAPSGERAPLSIQA